MKITIMSLVLALFVSACSHKTESTIASKPQFTFAAADLAVPVEIVTNGADLSAEHKAAKVVLMLSAKGTADFQKFTQEHLKQKVQILAGSRVLSELIFESAISTGEMDFGFSTREEAQAVADLLNKR